MFAATRNLNIGQSMQHRIIEISNNEHWNIDHTVKNIFSEENNIGVFGANDRCDRKMSRILWKCVQTMVEYPIAVQRSLNLGEQNREN